MSTEERVTEKPCKPEIIEYIADDRMRVVSGFVFAVSFL